MTNLIGDVCAPSDFILPLANGANFGKMSGALFVSGANLCRRLGTGAIKVITES